MGLSPSTLFHLTSKDGLKGILEDNFKLKYCKELISHNEKPIEIAVPMVSFCDIKISEITEHISKYGEYGIGLSKDWAFSKDLNPVIYMNHNSVFCNKLITSMRTINGSESISLDDRMNVSNFIRYIKIYEGELNRKGNIISNYRFADEREWRYVPNMEFKDSKFPPYINLSKDLPETFNMKKENEKLIDERLIFEPNDILYILVRTEDEIDEIIQHIKTAKGKNFSLFDIERLTTRILSCERIFNDF